MLVKKLRNVWASLSVIAVCLFANQAQAAVINAVFFSAAQTPLSKVLLMATLNNGPAMRPVQWQLYRVKNGRSTLVQSFKRHSASLELEPGIYRAEAELDNVSRSRVFDISTVSNSNVIVAMD
ncbi:MAG: hypothetical protein R3E93_08230 [Thiothrix sp.]